MSEHEIIGTELANEVINAQTSEANVSNGLSTGTKILIGTGITLAAWKTCELIVNGFRWIKAKVKSKKAAKVEPKGEEDFPTLEVDESRFDD